MKIFKEVRKLNKLANLKSITLKGYVNLVGRPSEMLHSEEYGDFIEIILPGAFEKALLLAEDVDLIFNHRESRKMGSIKQGNVELYEDNLGLRIKCTITDPLVIKQAENGELRGWSFEFKPYRQHWITGNDGIKRRFIRDLSLKSVSLAGMGQTPAYNDTSVEISATPYNSLDIVGEK